jgi:hypothetical protein
MAVVGSISGIWRLVLASGLAWACLAERLERSQRWIPQACLAALLVTDLWLATGSHGALRAFPLDLARSYQVTGLAPVAPDFLARQQKAAGHGRVEINRFRPQMASEPSHIAHRMSCLEPLVPEAWSKLSQEASLRTAGTTLFDLDPEKFPTLFDITSVWRILLPAFGGGARVIQNRDALPRAYFADRVETRTQEQALDHVLAGDFDFHRAITIERDPELAPSRRRRARHRPQKILEVAAERVVIGVDAPGPGILVLADTHYPGWRAQVDGRDAEIFRVNGLQRGVKVDIGDERVEFEYRPASLRRGAVISIASAVILLSVVLIDRRRARSAVPSQGGP